MTTFTASEARIRFAEMLSIVGFGKDRVLIEKHNRPVAALVPIEELELLDDLLVAARDDGRFRERVAALAAARDHNAVYALFSNPSESIELEPESFGKVLDAIRYPRGHAGAEGSHGRGR